MAEAVGKDRLFKNTDALRRCHRRHYRCLRIGGKGGIRRGADRTDGSQLVTAQRQLPCKLPDLAAAVKEDIRHRAQVVRFCLRQREFPPCRSCGAEVGCRLHAVGHDRIFRAVQRSSSVDAQHRGARAVDLRAAGGQEADQIPDLRLPRRVAQHGLSLTGQRG